MKAKVVGIENVNYVSKRTGKPVEGVSVHVLRAPSAAKAKNMRGLMVDTVYISSSSEALFDLACNSLALDTMYDFKYDSDGQYSFLEDIVLAE